MNKHIVIAPVLFMGATALLLFSMSLPDDTVIATNPSPSPVAATASPGPTPKPGTTPKPGVTPAPGKTAAPSATPKPSNSPCPPGTSASASPPPVDPAAPTANTNVNGPCNPLPSYGIAATLPDTVLREARIQAGRVDPFKSVFPPDLPEFQPAVSAEQLSLPDLPPLPQSSGEPSTPTAVATPRPNPPNTTVVIPTPPRPALNQGLELKGIMDGGVDPIAIVDVRGKTELVRVGERLTGGILVTSINFDEHSITLSRGYEHVTLRIPEPNSPSY